jgi:hypothetical protein
VRLALLAEAEAELEAAATWYDDRSEGLGGRVLGRRARFRRLEGAELIDRGRGAGTTGTIGTTRFTLSFAKARALQRGRSYRVFLFRHSRAVAGAEPTLDQRER